MKLRYLALAILLLAPAAHADKLTEHVFEAPDCNPELLTCYVTTVKKALDEVKDLDEELDQFTFTVETFNAEDGEAEWSYTFMPDLKDSVQQLNRALVAHLEERKALVAEVQPQ